MTRYEFALLALAAVGYVVWRDWQRSAEPGAQAPDFIDQAENLFYDATEGTFFGGTEETDMGQAANNRAAFLMMIRTAEGTAGANGYRMLFGGGTFDSYADHPRQVVTAMSNGKPISSSAAGAYQFLRRTWDTLAARLGLTDFTPASQDAAALELIRDAGALGDVDAGRFALAVRKVRKIWASMPGAGYGQPEVALNRLQAAYEAAGGVVYG
ncbi:glycoside hydrolase family 24 protein [Cupriavidus campinensis]|uniref:glycoside hydrolase family 24 protein n=1 Tax=Cupriavidus campinensis TaxID=151783 RepID=UPI0024E1C9CD|nr:glycoside hydrolase family 104 protein [Cupriavidus campinensis]